jgi:hypothetical protein
MSEGWVIPRHYRCRMCGAARVRLWAGDLLGMEFCASCKDKWISDGSLPEDAFKPHIPGNEDPFSSNPSWAPDGYVPPEETEAWWNSLPVEESRRFLEIEHDPICLPMVRRVIASGSKLKWPDDRERMEDALESLVAAGLAPQEWIERVASWTEETSWRWDEIRLRGSPSSWALNVIDPRALDTILLNPKSVLTAEKILLDHIDADDYLGVRSWDAILFGETGVIASDRPCPRRNVTRFANRYLWENRSALGESWADLLSACQPHSTARSVLGNIGAIIFAAGHEDEYAWCQEIAALGLAFCPWKVMENDRRKIKWAIVAGSDRGAPWPMFKARVHNGVVSWDDPLLTWTNPP